jgi:hypothetical protein
MGLFCIARLSFPILALDGRRIFIINQALYLGSFILNETSSICICIFPRRPIVILNHLDHRLVFCCVHHHVR